MDTIKALYKWLISFHKNTWEFEDYPIKTWKIQNATQAIKYRAAIINWYGMIEDGETAEKAIENLKALFEKINNRYVPRPGTKISLKLGTTELIDKYEEIAVDFFNKVLDLNYYEGFCSDHSALVYLEPSEDEEINKGFRNEIINKTHCIYKVDISDIYDEPLYKIFERIKNNQNRFSYNRDE